MPIAESKAGELIDQINLAESQGEISEFELAKFFSEARKVVKIDPETGYGILGILFALKHDYRQSMKNHEKALSFSRSPTHLHNFALSLYRIGYYRSSIQYLEELHDLLQDNYEALNPKDIFDALFLLAECNWKIGNVSKVEELIKEIKKSVDLDQVEGGEVLGVFERDVKELAEVLKANAIPESVLTQMESDMDKLVNENDLIVNETTLFSFDEEGVPVIVMQKRVDADVNTTLELNNSLIDGWVDSNVQLHESSRYISAEFLASN